MSWVTRVQFGHWTSNIRADARVRIACVVCCNRVRKKVCAEVHAQREPRLVLHLCRIRRRKYEMSVINLRNVDSWWIRQRDVANKVLRV